MQKLIKITSNGNVKLDNGTIISAPITEPFWLEDYQVFDLLAHGCAVSEFVKGTKGNGFVPLNPNNYNTINILPDQLVDHRYDNYNMPNKPEMVIEGSNIPGAGNVEDYIIPGIKLDTETLLDVMRNVCEAKHGFKTLKQAIDFDGDIDNVEYKDNTLYFYSNKELVKSYKLTLSSSTSTDKDGISLPTKILRYLEEWVANVDYGTNPNCMDLVRYTDPNIKLGMGVYVSTQKSNNLAPYKIGETVSDADRQAKMDDVNDMTEPYYAVNSPENIKLVKANDITIENFVFCKAWKPVLILINNTRPELCGVYIPKVTDGTLSWEFKQLTALTDVDMNKLVSATSIVGPAGKDGINGKDGAPGEKGDKGDKGDTGATGPMGPAGKDGTNGTPGEKGEKGDTGATGATGPMGPAGKDGINGTPGEKGEKGDTGATGPMGPAGKDGINGTNGTPGEKGDKGDKGDTGATGPMGPAGKDGTVPAAKTGEVEPSSITPDYIGQVYVNTAKSVKRESPFIYLSFGTNVGEWSALA